MLKILGLERDIERHGRQAGRPDTFFDPPDRVNGNLKVAIKKIMIFQKCSCIFAISKILSPIDASLREESIGERILLIGEIFVHFRKNHCLERDIERHGGVTHNDPTA